jgi:hypothetical protein
MVPGSLVYVTWEPMGGVFTDRQTHTHIMRIIMLFATRAGVPDPGSKLWVQTTGINPKKSGECRTLLFPNYMRSPWHLLQYYTYALVEYHHLSKIIIAHIPFF